MEKSTNEVRDAIIEAVLPAIAFDGWTIKALEDAAVSIDMDISIVASVFPDGLAQAVSHFADLYDRKMLTALENVDPEKLKVRERVAKGVMTRLELLTPHKEAVKQALSFWSVPTRAAHGGKSVWRTADCIWIWAGDDAKDYNRYTKRILLSGVISSTTLAWLDDESDDMHITVEFLDRRIANVLKVGQFIGRFKKSS